MVDLLGFNGLKIKATIFMLQQCFISTPYPRLHEAFSGSVKQSAGRIEKQLTGRIEEKVLSAISRLRSLLKFGVTDKEQYVI